MSDQKICAILDDQTAQRFRIACAGDGPRGKKYVAVLRELIERYLAERGA